MRRLLLCTDLDRTLLPNGTVPESSAARPLFRRLAAAAGVTLVYVTGRDAGRVAEAVNEHDLPTADHLVCDVGSTILDADGRRRADWDSHIAAGWGGRGGADLAGLIGTLPGLERQDQSRQGPFKLSYEVRPPGGTDARARTIAERLRAAGLQVSVVPSHDDAAGVGLIDVLPAAAGKAAAIGFLREQLGFSLDEAVFAGDSGNDLDVLTGPVPAVLVANAASAVREAALAGAVAAGHADRLHLARGGVLGLNGNYAAGILEGVLHYQPAWAAVLEGAS